MGDDVVLVGDQVVVRHALGEVLGPARRHRTRTCEGVEDQVRLGLEIVTSRPADPKAVAVINDMAAKLKEDHGLNDEQALERFCLVALNLNEFLFID